MIDINKRLVNILLDLINNLAIESKLELLIKLKASISSQKEGENISILSLFGSFESDKESAERIINEIKGARVFARNIESFD